MQYFDFDRPSFGIKTFGFGSSEFSPLDLFAGGKQGAWYDPSDKTTLFQDAAGTVPVTKDGDPVGLMLDKSGNNNHATQTASAARPVYKTDDILHWLSFDGVDDFMSILNVLATQVMHTTIGVSPFNTLGIFRLISKGSSANASTINGDWLLTPNKADNLRLFAGEDSINKLTVTADKTVSTNIYSYTIDNAGHTLGLNNTYARLNSPQITSNNNEIRIAADANGTYTLEGKLHSLVLCVDVLSEQKKSDLYDYVAIKSGVTL